MRREPLLEPGVLLQFDAARSSFHLLPHAHEAMLNERKCIDLTLAVSQQSHRQIELYLPFEKSRRLHDGAQQLFIAKARKQILVLVDDLLRQPAKLSAVAKMVGADGDDEMESLRRFLRKTTNHIRK